MTCIYLNGEVTNEERIAAHKNEFAHIKVSQEITKKLMDVTYNHKQQQKGKGGKKSDYHNADAAPMVPSKKGPMTLDELKGQVCNKKDCQGCPRMHPVPDMDGQGGLFKVKSAQEEWIKANHSKAAEMLRQINEKRHAKGKGRSKSKG